MVHEGVVLVHVISTRGIEVDKAKIEVIEQLPPPTSVKGAEFPWSCGILLPLHKGFL